MGCWRKTHLMMSVLFVTCCWVSAVHMLSLLGTPEMPFCPCQQAAPLMT